jgi:DinB family protein
VHDRNQSSRQRLRAVVERVGPGSLGTSLPGGWTVSALLAHLAWWDRIALERWDDLIQSEVPPTYIADSINDEMLPRWRSVPAEEAVREALAAAEAVDARIASAPDDLVARVGREWPRMLDRSLHRNEHLDEIDRAVSPPT